MWYFILKIYIHINITNGSETVDKLRRMMALRDVTFVLEPNCCGFSLPKMGLENQKKKDLKKTGRITKIKL